MCTQINFINGLYLHLNIRFVGNDPHINPTRSSYDRFTILDLFL